MTNPQKDMVLCEFEVIKVLELLITRKYIW